LIIVSWLDAFLTLGLAGAVHENRNVNMKTGKKDFLISEV
jgi:hypothetical protein